MNQEIIQKLKAEKSNLYDKYKVTRLGVFGSFARGEEKPESDIDILVEFSEVPGMKDFFNTEEYLENLLKRKIDLVREKSIRSELKENIMSEVIFI
ncbi:MAG: nucleotidyltransferase family protein [Spirochaetes bacterium]|nr:nucleotidyltransferase family protein [Spirochaetota bacterium]